MPAKACHDFNNNFTLFTAVPVLFNMYTDKDSNLISEFVNFVLIPFVMFHRYWIWFLGRLFGISSIYHHPG